MPTATITFDDPSGRAVNAPISSPTQVRNATQKLQESHRGLNFLADIVVPSRERFSVILAHDRGAAIVWRDPVMRTLGASATRAQIAVWDGAGVEMPARYSVPMSQLISVIEEWIASGTLSRNVSWTSEDYNT